MPFPHASPPPVVRPDAPALAERVVLVALDVDGTLTDGAIYIGPAGEAMKRFSVHDGFGLRLLREAGIAIALVTGRRSTIVEARARELGIDEVLQGVDDKVQALRALCERRGIGLEAAAFVGDDWPDLAVMRAAGLAATVPHAAPEVRAIAHWIAGACAGEGAVRQFATWLLEAQGRLEGARARYLVRGGGVA